MKGERAMARKHDTSTYKKLLLHFMGEADPLYSMLQWLAERMMEVEAELKGDPRNPCEQSVLMLCTHHNGCADLRAVFVCYHGPYGDGLIIGLGGGSEARVVTAFRARRAYWNKVMVRDRCLPINMDFLGAWMRIWYPGLFQ